MKVIFSYPPKKKSEERLTPREWGVELAEKAYEGDF